MQSICRSRSFCQGGGSPGPPDRTKALTLFLYILSGKTLYFQDFKFHRGSIIFHGGGGGGGGGGGEDTYNL